IVFECNELIGLGNEGIVVHGIEVQDRNSEGTGVRARARLACNHKPRARDEKRVQKRRCIRPVRQVDKMRRTDLDTRHAGITDANNQISEVDEHSYRRQIIVDTGIPERLDAELMKSVLSHVNDDNRAREIQSVRHCDLFTQHPEPRRERKMPPARRQRTGRVNTRIIYRTRKTTIIAQNIGELIRANIAEIHPPEIYERHVLGIETLDVLVNDLQGRANRRSRCGMRSNEHNSVELAADQVQEPEWLEHRMADRVPRAEEKYRGTPLRPGYRSKQADDLAIHRAQEPVPLVLQL